MTAWIMVDSNGVPFNRNMYALYEGFKELGEPIKTYNASHIFTDYIPCTKDDIVVGHIDHCRRHVKKITGKDTPNIDYPMELIPYMGRKFRRTTLNEIYTSILDNDGIIEPIFIKPVEQKHFTGFVCRSFSDFSKKCVGHDHSKEIYCSGVVNFVSEYRVYIHRHRVSACLRYAGDYSVAPSKRRVEEMLYALRNANMPVAYSIDVGVTDTVATLLVECNDGFALGNYGMLSRDYAEMHRDRWNQLVEDN